MTIDIIGTYRAPGSFTAIVYAGSPLMSLLTFPPNFLRCLECQFRWIHTYVLRIVPFFHEIRVHRKEVSLSFYHFSVSTVRTSITGSSVAYRRSPVTNHHFKWWFEKPYKGLLLGCPKRAVSQAYYLATLGKG